MSGDVRILDRLDAIMTELFDLATDEDAPALVRRIATCGADALLVGLEVERDRLSGDVEIGERPRHVH